MHTAIYDIRRDGIDGYVESVNNRITRWSPDYKDRFGLVGSEKWITMYAEGKISLNIKCGQISYIGLDKCEPIENEYVIEINTERRMIAYDQEGYWLNPLVKLDAWVKIETVKITTPEPGGSITSLVDINVAISE